jgi:hypothetical protein
MLLSGEGVPQSAPSTGTRLKVGEPPITAERRSRDLMWLVVRGLDEHWSLGARGHFQSSTFDNTEADILVSPAVPRAVADLRRLGFAYSRSVVTAAPRRDSRRSPVATPPVEQRVRDPHRARDHLSIRVALCGHRQPAVRAVTPDLFLLRRAYPEVREEPLGASTDPERDPAFSRAHLEIVHNQHRLRRVVDEQSGGRS